ncbi:Somatostatin receptor type 4 [Holothuria leucospilota]|uniref:Somatostatin receptor type 4 n=1 Tax=Holothuria leucospilota TaxID=206669 RepID=A0A9Q0YJG5_HOLLE|nr:Somatostatin receptor type 4 [Holothuria leucospilota]
MTMTAIAVDRYYAVRKPMVFKMKFSVKRTKILIISLWGLALIAAVPTAFMFKSVYVSQDDKSNYKGKTPFACKLSLPFGAWFKDFKAIYLNVVLFLLPVTITSILFVRIVLYVRQSNLAINKRFANAAGAIRNSHWTTAKSLLAVFVVFVFCYMPFSMYNIMQRYAPAVLSANFKNVALLLPYANSCLNPVVYSFTSERFRRYCVRLLCPCNRKTIATRHPSHSGDSAGTDQQSHSLQRFASILAIKDYKV